MPIAPISRRGMRTERTCITVSVPGTSEKSKAPATESLSSSVESRSARSPAWGSWTQKAVKIGNSSASGPPLPMERPRAERP